MDSKNLLLAAALSGLALTASANEATKTPAEAATKEAKAVEGKCFGVNTCKGTSACHSEKNACAGQNSCKGKGWMKKTDKECKEMKGTFKA